LEDLSNQSSAAQLYTEYVNNHPEAISLLIELNSNSKKFAALIKV
jgi:hypothetical protein